MVGEKWTCSVFQDLIDAGLIEIGDGYRAKNNELGGDGPIFLRAGHVTDTHIAFDGVERFRVELSNRVRSKMAMSGDTIVTTKGNSTGRTSYVTSRMPPFVYSPHLSYWRSLNHSQLVPGFLRYWSQGLEFAKQLQGMKASTDMAPYLSLTDQKRLRITLPPARDQKAIAHILGTLDDKIELNRRMNETLEAMARAIFKSWFVDFDPVRAKAAGNLPSPSGRGAGGEGLYCLPKPIADLFPDSFEDSEIGKIPKGWRAGCIRELCQKIENGGTPKRHVEDYWHPEEVPWLTSGEVRQGFIVRTENFISKEGLDNSSAKIWPCFTTVVALYGATAGYASLLGLGLCANQACCALVPLPEATCFNFLAVSSALGHFQQQTRGSAQQNLSQSIVADLPTIVPPKNVLAAFSNQVQPLLSHCVQNIMESVVLSATRDALLLNLLSGKLQVSEAKKTVSSLV